MWYVKPVTQDILQSTLFFFQVLRSDGVVLFQKHALEKTINL